MYWRTEQQAGRTAAGERLVKVEAKLNGNLFTPPDLVGEMFPLGV
jgi:hypothetical protein